MHLLVASLLIAALIAALLLIAALIAALSGKTTRQKGLRWVDLEYGEWAEATGLNRFTSFDPSGSV